jgi:RHS repeat-associated protein
MIVETSKRARVTDPAAAQLPISLKTQAFEGVVMYYGYRFYDPETGRWPSRDPIEEMGGLNLYGFTFNAPYYWYDYLGANPKPIDVGADDVVPPPPSNASEQDIKTLNDLRQSSKVHSDAYGIRVSFENLDKLIQGIKNVIEKNGECCVKNLNITSHGILGNGGLSFSNGTHDKGDDEQFSGEEDGVNFGKKLKPFMCKDCQINLRGCSALAGEKFGKNGKIGSGFAHSLAKETGCKVLGNSEGFCIIGWATDFGTTVPTWGNSRAEDIIQINPDGTSITHEGTGHGPRPDGRGRFPNAK